MTSFILPRRRFLALGAAGFGSLLLGGCDELSESSDFQAFLASAEELTYGSQRLLGGRHSMAREFTAADLSPEFKVNGTHKPEGDKYAALVESNFADWRLRVDGLVVKPLDLSLADLKKSAAADPDHAARLRRGVERHRQMAGPTACLCALSGAFIAKCTVCCVPLCRHL